MYGRNLKAYRQTSVRAEISVADPYVITKMLYQGVFERLAQAKGAILRGDLATKASRLASAVAILEHLKTTLDFNQNKQIAQNLFDLYSFMIDKLNDATVNVQIEPIDDALRVLMPIKSAWDQIPVSAQQEASQKRKVDHLNGQSNLDNSLAHGTI